MSKKNLNYIKFVLNGALLLISFGCGSRCRCLWGYGLLYICGWCRSASYFFNAFYILRDLWFPLLETTNFYQIMRIIKFQNYQKCRSKPDYEYSTLKLPYLPCAIETLTLTFWRRNYFFILAHPVNNMWIIQEPNTLELWNKLHFEEEITKSIYHV